MKRFLILTLSTASLLFAVFVTGCNNIVENEVGSENSSTISDSETKTKPNAPKRIATVSGSMNIRGAFPEEIVNQLNHVILNTRHAELVSASDSSRTAFPSIPESGLTVEIKAVNITDDDDTYDATSIDWEHRTFEIGIPVGSEEVSYKITVSLKNTGNEVILYGESEEFPISSENPLADVEVNISAKQTTGSTPGHGNIALQIEIEDGSDISYCIHSKAGYRYNKNDNVITISMTGVLSGQHNFYIWFYNSFENILYRIDEAVNVFDNLTTNTWVKNGNDPWLVTSGTETICRITNAMVEGYKLTEIWVDETRSIDEMEDNYTSQSGTFLNPKVDLSGALSMLNDATKDYTIFIKGTLTGPQVIPESLKKTGSGGGYTYAKSLTICGDTGLNNSGLPQDELKVTGTGTVLTITTNVPVIIKDLKITGGKQSTESGGGIYINNSEANVYLTNGALITGNQAKVGGGAYVAQGNLFVYGSAVIGKSGVSSHAEDAENSFGNKATTSGGGIGVGSGTLWLGYSSENVPAETSGGVIYNLVKGESSTHGGGIDNQSGTVKIAAGNVSYNYACSTLATGCGGGISTANALDLTGTAVIEGNASAYGGGVYITYDSSEGIFEMTGGTIKLNSAEVQNSTRGDGGGVAIANHGSFTMSGGIISSNTAANYGGAVMYDGGFSFLVSDSAYIPYDSLNSRNDISLETPYWITLKNPLTPPAECTDGLVGRITPRTYSTETTVLSLDSSATTTIAAEMFKFTVTPQTSPAQTWTITSDGKLAASMELTNANITNFTASSIVADQEYHFVIGPDVTQANYETFMGKLFASGTALINEKSTLDLSRATNVKSLGVKNVSSSVKQKFDAVIISPGFPGNYFTSNDSTNDHTTYRYVKKILAPLTSQYYYSDENGVLYNKDITKLVYFPGGYEGSEYTTPAGVTEIIGNAFSYTQSSLGITISSDVITIGNAAFFNSSYITSVDILGQPEIEDVAFSGCGRLERVTFPGTPSTGFNIPSYWTEIPGKIFNGCSKCTSITVPDTIMKINYMALPQGSAFVSLTISGTWSLMNGNTVETTVTMTDAETNATWYRENCYNNLKTLVRN